MKSPHYLSFDIRIAFSNLQGEAGRFRFHFLNQVNHDQKKTKSEAFKNFLKQPQLFFKNKKYETEEELQKKSETKRIL